jgi:peptidoglycan/LPS O-acetylase OafA/YrhL
MTPKTRIPPAEASSAKGPVPARGHGRFAVLDGVRGVAAIAVALYHFTDYSGNGLFPFGWTAVDLFFILSGFVVAFAYEDKIVAGGLTCLAFFRLRVIRLYPLYLTGLALGVIAYEALGSVARAGGINLALRLATGVLFLPYPGSSRIPFPGEIMNLAAGAPNWLFPLNVPSWSLFFEIAINAVFGYLVAARRFRFTHLLWAGIAGVLFYRFLGWTVGGHGVLGGGWGWRNAICGGIRVTYGFPLGVVIYHLFAKNRLPSFSVNGWWIVAATMIAMSVRIHPGTSIALNYPYLLSLVVWPLLIWLGAQAVVGDFGTRAFSWLGGISYAVYAIHFPLLRLICIAMKPGSTSAVLVGLAATLALAHLLTYHLDPRLRRFLARLWPAKTAP